MPCATCTEIERFPSDPIFIIFGTLGQPLAVPIRLSLLENDGIPPPVDAEVAVLLEKLWGLIRLVVADDETHFARAVAFAVGVDDVFDPGMILVW